MPSATRAAGVSSRTWVRGVARGDAQFVPHSFRREAELANSCPDQSAADAFAPVLRGNTEVIQFQLADVRHFEVFWAMRGVQLLNFRIQASQDVAVVRRCRADREIFHIRHEHSRAYHTNGDVSSLDPDLVRAALASRQMSPAGFRAALENVPRAQRDAWVNRIFGLGELPEDSRELPRGCVPYLPCAVDTILRMIDLADIGCDDVFVDIGSGLGRTTALTHLLTGASAIGVEIQSELVRGSRELAARLNAARVSTIEGDAISLTHSIALGSVFFLYCPFGADRAHQVLDAIGEMARTRIVRVCSVDLPLPARAWLEPVSISDDLAVYRSRPLDGWE
jgi:precorrin-6B methylase 2